MPCFFLPPAPSKGGDSSLREELLAVVSPFGGGWGEEKREKLMFKNFLKIRIDSLISLFAKIVKEP